MINQTKLDEAIVKAVAQLKKSERGQQCLADLKTMMKNGADGLDPRNQTAICVLFLAAIKEGKRDFIADI